MPGGIHWNSKSPRHDGKNCQVAFNTHNVYKSRGPLTKLLLNSNTIICENINQEINDTRNEGYTEQYSAVCCNRPQENHTTVAENATKIVEKQLGDISDRTVNLSENLRGDIKTGPSLNSGSLPVITDECSKSDSSVCEQKVEVAEVDEAEVEEAKVEEAEVEAEVEEAEVEEAEVEAYLCDPLKSKKSFVIHVKESTNLSSERESFQSGACTTTKPAEDETKAITIQSVCPAASATTASCDTSKSSSTTASKSNKVDNTYEDNATDDNITPRPSDSTTALLPRERPVVVDSHQTKRTTDELSTSSVNSSGKKYSDFSISFLLRQDSSAVSCTIRCNNTDTIQTIPRPPAGPSDNTRCGTFSQTHCGNTPASCSCDDCSSNEVTIARRFEDNSCSRQIPRAADQYCGKNHSTSTSAFLFKNINTTLGSRHEKSNLPTTSSSRPYDEKKLNSPEKDSPVDGSDMKLNSPCTDSPVDGSGIKVAEDDNLKCSRQACYTPVGRQLNLENSRQACSTPVGRQLNLDSSQQTCYTPVGRQLNLESSRKACSTLVGRQLNLESSRQACSTPVGRQLNLESSRQARSTPVGRQLNLDSSQQACSTPVGRQHKRAWTSDLDTTQSEHDSSLDAPMILARAKMSRSKYTEEQVLYLKDEFAKSRYPSYDDLVKMSDDTDVPVRQLQVWFQNKRASTTGTRRPKIKRTDDYLECESPNKPSTSNASALPRQARLVSPTPYTAGTGQGLTSSAAKHDYGYQHYTPRMFTDLLGSHHNLAMDTFASVPQGLTQTPQRHVLPVQYPSHVYSGPAFTAASLQTYLASVYSHSPAVRIGYPDISYLPLLTPYMTQSGTPAMAGVLPTGYSQLFGFLGNPGVPLTHPVSRPRDTKPLDDPTLSLFPPGSSNQHNHKLP